MDRYKCIPVETDAYALGLLRYIHRNPIRAGMVREPEEWRWSGYRFYTGLEDNDLLTPHPSYLALSESEERRREKYRDFVRSLLPSDDKRDPYYSAGILPSFSPRFSHKL